MGKIGGGGLTLPPDPDTLMFHGGWRVILTVIEPKLINKSFD